MATLNIKQFPDPLYRRLQARAKAERRSLAQEVIHLLKQASATKPPASLLELEGLGAEMWRELRQDAAEHVRRERDSWD